MEVEALVIGNTLPGVACSMHDIVNVRAVALHGAGTNTSATVKKKPASHQATLVTCTFTRARRARGAAHTLWSQCGRNTGASVVGSQHLQFERHMVLRIHTKEANMQLMNVCNKHTCTRARKSRNSVHH